MTVLGGSISSPELEAVMAQAGRHFVRIADLEVAAGKRISEMLKLLKATAPLSLQERRPRCSRDSQASSTGDNEQFIKQISRPHRDEVGSHYSEITSESFRSSARTTGIKLVVIETRDELLAAINEKTAMMHFSNFANAAGQIKVDEWIKIGKEHNILGMNDAAADTPPVSHLWDYANMGYDLITFSGGKAMRGPQCAGMLNGKNNWLQMPFSTTARTRTRSAAVRKLAKKKSSVWSKPWSFISTKITTHSIKEWQDRLEYISSRITRVPGVSTSYFTPDIANHVPHMSDFVDFTHQADSQGSIRFAEEF
jgi:L-seryl-tRNA(Ser) seleniumtransferase